MRFSVTADEVAPEHLPEYRRKLVNFLEASSWRFFLPWNQARPDDPEGFGLLPSPEKGVAAYVSPADPATFDEASDGDSSARTMPGSSTSMTGTDWGSSWKFAVPVMIAVALATTRSCETSNFYLPPSSPTGSLLSSDSRVSLPQNQNDLVFSTPPNNSFLTPQRSIYPLPRNLAEPFVPTEVVSRVEPEYPPELLKLGKSGQVILEFVVSPRGEVGEIKAISSDDPLFTASAIRALGQWKFTPRASSHRIRVPIAFELNSVPKKAAAP
jgi:TonB family protein